MTAETARIFERTDKAPETWEPPIIPPERCADCKRFWPCFEAQAEMPEDCNQYVSVFGEATA